MLTSNDTDRHRQLTLNHVRSDVLWLAEITTLVSTLTLVAYHGKPMYLPPARSPHGMTFDMF